MEDINKENITNKPSVKDNWLKVDKTCPQCGQVTEKAKGITKQSMKKLFSFNLKKDWLSTLIIIGVILLAYAYKQDTAACKDFMSHRTEYCAQILADEAAYGDGLNLENLDELNTGFGNGLAGNLTNSTKWNTV